MRIKSFRHKALKRLFLQDDPKGLPAECVDKLRAILTFLQEMRSPKTLRTFPFCSLHVNRNRPLTFKRRTMKSPISILNITINEDAMRMLNPVHPGPFIKTEIIAAHNLSVTAAATILGVSRPAPSTFLNGKSDLSGDIALRIEKAFGVDMETLMRMQNSYDIARTRKRAGQIKVSRFQGAEAHR